MPVLDPDQPQSETPTVRFTGPWSYIVWMALFVVVVALIGIVLREALVDAFLANMAINGLILGVLVIGITYTFVQAASIGPAAHWLKRFRSAEHASQLPTPPAMIAPMASMIGDADGRVRLSAGSVRTVLDSLGARMAEAGALTRYAGRLLIFLGLLGTFWGLLEVVRDVGAAVSAVSANSTGNVDPTQLINAIQGPIQGMGTAFASSLIGLGGSLVIGFLDLQASRANNRFFNEVEEWLSSISRVAAAGPAGGAGEGEMSGAYVGALLEQTADTLDRLAHTLERHNRQLDTTLQRFAEDAREGQQEAIRALRDEIKVLIRTLEHRDRGGQ